VTETTPVALGGSFGYPHFTIWGWLVTFIGQNLAQRDGLSHPFIFFIFYFFLVFLIFH